MVIWGAIWGLILGFLWPGHDSDAQAVIGAVARPGEPVARVDQGPSATRQNSRGVVFATRGPRQAGDRSC